MNEGTQRLSVKDALKGFFTRQDRFLVAAAVISLLIIIVFTPVTRNQTELNTRISDTEITKLTNAFLRKIG